MTRHENTVYYYLPVLSFHCQSPVVIRVLFVRGWHTIVHSVAVVRTVTCRLSVVRGSQRVLVLFGLFRALVLQSPPVSCTLLFDPVVVVAVVVLAVVVVDAQLQSLQHSMP